MAKRLRGLIGVLLALILCADSAQFLLLLLLLLLLLFTQIRQHLMPNRLRVLVLGSAGVLDHL
jgi:hypothetical protein